MIQFSKTFVNWKLKIENCFSTLATKKTEEEVKTRVRIKVRAYDAKIIDNSVRSIVDTALRNGAEVVGPLPLPTEIHRYTVNRSSFVHKNAREQYEMRVHKRLIDILSPTPSTINSLTNLNLPAGVDIEVKMMWVKNSS